MNRSAFIPLAAVSLLTAIGQAADVPASYRHFEVTESQGRITGLTIKPEPAPPRWARDVSPQVHTWPAPQSAPSFAGPIQFVRPPVDPGETLLPHNHQPSITWLPNGDLLAIWYSTKDEAGPELTVMASRLRHDASQWDPASVFFKAANHNMHGSAIFHDGEGNLHHLNGIAPAGVRGWAALAVLHRSSRDNGVTWSSPDLARPVYQQRQQVISGTFLTNDGTLIQPCDAVPGGEGGTALLLSRDHGKTWSDPGEGKPAPVFADGNTGQGTIAGIHAGVVQLKDGHLLALGRGNSINGCMPLSVSADLGRTWIYHASPFPPIGGGQRLVFRRLREGPLLLISFTNPDRTKPRGRSLPFPTPGGGTFRGDGLFAAVSFDEGKTWPVRKLITPGAGEFNGGAWTGMFTATQDHAEPAGYLAATQTPDGMIQLISSGLHYRFNLAWLQQTGNPLFRGADPHACLIGGSYWVYPTGGGTRLFARVSNDLRSWDRRGPLLDLNDIPWVHADGRRDASAWAPCLAQSGGKCYFYFSVGPQSPGFPSRIGVATGSSPAGPFKDSGQPLLTGGEGFEAIDPMVFHDPKSNHWFLYAGGSAGAKLRVFQLAANLVSITREIPVATPPNFTEGAFMHCQVGLYHLTYSHGRWQHADYSVHHATAPTPTGPWTYRGAILTSDVTHRGPGHHSIMQNPGTGTWQIFYHRWDQATGDGPFQGSRQVAVDRLIHLPDGRIEPVKMTD